MVLFALPLGLVLRHTYRNEERLRLQRDTIAATRAIDLGAPGSDPVELPRKQRHARRLRPRRSALAGHGPAPAPALVRKRPAHRPRPPTGAAAVARGRRAAARRRAGDRRAAGAAHRRRCRHATPVGAWLVAGRHRRAPRRRRAWPRGCSAGGWPPPGASGRLRPAASARVISRSRARARAAPEVDAVADALDATARAPRRSGRARARVQRRRLPPAAHAAGRAANRAGGVALRDDPPPELPAALAQVDRLQATIETLLAVARDAPRPSAVADAAVVLPTSRSAGTGRWRPRGARCASPWHAGHLDPRLRRVVTEILDVLMDNAHRHGAGAVTRPRRLLGRCWRSTSPTRAPASAATPRRVPAPIRGGEGHGIGLALARSLAHAEGGRLSVSRSGPGPILTVMMPHAETVRVP